MSNSQGNQGLQGGWAVDDGGNLNFAHSLASQLGMIRDAGATIVRINFRLGRCFTDWTTAGCNGKSALQTYQPLVQQVFDANLAVLGLVANESWHGGQGDWTANNAERGGGDGDNSYIDDFAQYAAGVLASSFPDITDWEVWNEPNAWTTSPGVGGKYIYPSNFAQLLSGSYAAIKSANAGATVVSGGLFCHEGDSGVDYLSNTYAMGTNYAGWVGGAYPLDAVGQHLYIDQGGTTSAGKISVSLQQLRDAYVAFEGADTSKLTQITEAGWATDRVSAAVQAQNLQTAYQEFQQTTYLERAYWFSIQDVPEGHLFFGLVDPSGGHKPAFDAYQTYATY